ncbi:CHASE3 domain-containing protein [Flavobacterium sp. ANB]|uniref:ATP-binding protein n=1 Tax=unclassified Flavobacterium TaxID=196869 RepID=UPI0012B71290|nr:MULTISPECIES: ATP-binding protein [unclassified Flavobacterium]MBF4515663.1 CHASE3 domain-containing protein [Flavobacterium sp. ANB]MTD68666.1 HAMP domain-containing protein [Flavobacterium sp. LC2016-13]
MKLSTQILLAFTLIILLSVADSYTNYMMSKKVQLNSHFLARSEEIIRNSNKTHKAIIGMQSAFRGYLLTDDKVFLDSYFQGLKNVPYLFKVQKKQIGDHNTQRTILDSIELLHNDWLKYSEQLIESRKRDANSLQITLRKHVGKKINDDIARKFTRFDRIEYKRRKHHSAMLLTSLKYTRTFSLIFLTLTIIVGVISTIYIMLITTKRISSMVRLAENISKGKFTSIEDTRNDELTALASSLNSMSSKLDKNIRELKSRNAELNKFAYVVSHDLKAPIRGIHNVITWIEEDLDNELSPELKRYLNIIPQKTKRMEALINGLLDYARLNINVPPELINTNTLVREIADSIVPRNFTLEIADLPELFTERIKLEQVFANLISNAVKYTPQENGKIEISCRKFYKHYEFSVKDNGIGIAGEYHKKIFEIFQTLREQNEQESTGVGLAIVKKIIDDQQEDIIVISKVGEGAEFIFTWRNS